MAEREKQCGQMPDRRNCELLMNVAVKAGEIMLKSGAEVYRVEDTISRILNTSGLRRIEVIALATGIFAMISDEGMQPITVVRRISGTSTNLNRIYLVNNVSRGFCSGNLSLEAAAEELAHIEQSVEYNFAIKTIGYMMVTGFFAIMFKGGIQEFLAAAAGGFLLSVTLTAAVRFRFNAFFQNAAGAFALAGFAICIRALLLPGMNLDTVIISGIMPMVPGLIFTAAIRDTLNGDYNSGLARIAEAIVVALAVASGVGAAMVLLGRIGGGL